MRKIYKSLDDYFTYNQNYEEYEKIKIENNIDIDVFQKMILNNKIPESYIHEINNYFNKEFTHLIIVM